ncbi:MAG: hypothetical protein ABIJ61_13535 [bacterium]
MTKHPDRNELIRAARGEGALLQEHLESCQECRLLVELLRTYQVEGELPLPHAPQTWRSRAAAIFQAPGVKAKVKSVLAKLIFDSWATPQPAGVRGLSSAAERRLRFESAEILFDLRAERFERGWAFVAQVTPKVILPAPLILEIGKKREVDAENDLYEWTDPKPPRKISLKSGDLVVQLPELKWRTSKSD